jgi:hypothetical protein
MKAPLEVETMWMFGCATSKLMGFFLEPIYNENNWKPQVTNFDSKVVASTIKL